MAEEGRERKKSAIIKRILKWIGIGWLALLVLAAAYFRAPWKVTALLLVFLCACTVLPKPARKWFWLSVGVILIVLIIWVFLPGNNEGWRPHTFDEELAALEANYAIPDSENAAVIYNQLLADEAKYKKRPQKEGDKLIAEALEKGTVSIPVEDVNDINDLFRFSYSTFYPDFWDSDIDYLTRCQTWSSKQYPRAAQWLRERENTTRMLLEASRKQRCSFPIPLDAMSLGLSLKRYAPMRRWALFLIQGANNDLGDGRTAEAAEKNLAVLQMANHLYQQPLLLVFLVGQAIEIHALENFKRAVIEEDLAGEHLDLTEETLQGIEHDWHSDFLRILRCEKIMAKNMLASLLFETNQRGQVRRARSPQIIAMCEDANDISKPTFWQKKLWKVGTIISWFFMPSDPQELVQVFDSAYETLYPMAEQDFDWQEKPPKVSLSSIEFNYRYMMVDLLRLTTEWGLCRFHEQYLCTAADRTGSLLIVELRRHKNKTGSWPESLDEIKDTSKAEYFVDPSNGGDFIYRLRPDTFILYSRGMNNIDEGGERWSEDDGTGPDDLLIWPPRGRKVKQEKVNVE